MDATNNNKNNKESTTYLRNTWNNGSPTNNTNREFPSSNQRPTTDSTESSTTSETITAIDKSDQDGGGGSTGVKLAKNLTLRDGVAIIVGSLIGSGIFITPTACLKYSGSVGASLVIWFVAGIFSLLGALSFAELGTTIPDNGGEYIYLLRAFGQLKGNFLAFLYIWVNVLIVRPVVLAIVVLSFAAYLLEPLVEIIQGIIRKRSAAAVIRTAVAVSADNSSFLNYYTTAISYSSSSAYSVPGSLPATNNSNIFITSNYFKEKLIELDLTFDDTWYVTKILALLGLGLLLYINSRSVKLAMKLQAFLTFSKVLALLLIIGIGIYQLFTGRTENFRNAFEGTGNVKQLALALYSGLFTYGGWNNLNSVTGEMKNPYRDLPLAIIIGLPLVIVIYLLTNVAYLTLLPPALLKVSTAVAFDFAAEFNYYFSLVMPLFVALSAFGSANALLFTSGRVFLMGAHHHHLQSVFAMINVTYLTPIPSILLQGFVSLFYVFNTDIFVLINFMSFISYLFTALCVVGLVYMRWKQPNVERHIKFPIILHLLFLLSSLFILVTSLISSYKEIGFGLLLLISGIPVYYIFIYKKFSPKCLTNITIKMTKMIQKLLLVVLPEDKDEKNYEFEDKMPEHCSKL